MSTEWTEAQRICDLPAVDEAIRNLIEDGTGDNATCLVREVMRSIAAGAAAATEGEKDEPQRSKLDRTVRGFAQIGRAASPSMGSAGAMQQPVAPKEPSSTPTRETLASLLAALFYGQYSSGDEEKSLRRDIERALRNYDIGGGEFVDEERTKG